MVGKRETQTPTPLHRSIGRLPAGPLIFQACHCGYSISFQSRFSKFRKLREKKPKKALKREKIEKLVYKSVLNKIMFYLDNRVKNEAQFQVLIFLTQSGELMRTDGVDEFIKKIKTS